MYALLGDSRWARASYEEALESLDRLPEPAAGSGQGVPQVRELRARACRGMGDLVQYEAPREALDWLQRGLEALDGASVVEEATLYIKTSSVQIALGNYEAALSALERGLKLLPEGPSQLRARALANIGNVYFYRGDVEQGRAYTVEGLKISEQLHDYCQMVACLHNLGVINEITGDWTGAAGGYQQALVLAERLGDITEQTCIRNALGILETKHDLGWHSENTVRGIGTLVMNGVITGKHKNTHPGRAVATAVGGGTKEEMDFINDNPYFAL